MRVNQVRSWINRWSSQVTVVAIVLLGLALFIVIKTGRPAGYSTPVSVYYYDLNTGELFAALSTEIPPIEAPSGPLPNGKPAGVRAFVYSCGDCSDPAQRRVAWLEKYTARAKARALAIQEWSEQDGPMPDSAFDPHVEPEFMPEGEIAFAPPNQPGDATEDQPQQIHDTAPAPDTDDTDDTDDFDDMDGTDESPDRDNMADSIDALDDGQLVKRPEDKRWVRAYSDEGMAITVTDIDICGEGEQYAHCRP